jgi:phosphohistidine phosphatase SixA
MPSRFLFAFLALLAAMPGRAQEPPGATRSSLPRHDLRSSELLASLRQGGYVLYFRHAATNFGQTDEKMKGYEDCADQRNLIDKGRTEARAAAVAIRGLDVPIGRVLASPFCRTVETAQLLFGRAEKMNEVRGGPALPAGSDRYAELKRILSTPVRPGTNLVVVSHGNPFYSVAGPPYLAEGEAAVVEPLGEDFRIVARVPIDGWEALKRAAPK